jgi:hypothetical protein
LLIERDKGTGLKVASAKLGDYVLTVTAQCKLDGNHTGNGRESHGKERMGVGESESESRGRSEGDFILRGESIILLEGSDEGGVS